MAAEVKAALKFGSLDMTKIKVTKANGRINRTSGAVATAAMPKIAGNTGSKRAIMTTHEHAHNSDGGSGCCGGGSPSK
jgi:hypothetical protein